MNAGSASPVSFGAPSGQLSFLGDSITLEYDNGAPCPTDASLARSTFIMFACDQAPPAAPLSVVGSFDTCSLVLQYRTPLACPPRQVECAVTDDATNTAYDLSPLARASSHWMAVGGEYTFVLGVCGPVTDSPPCPLGAASCQLKSSEYVMLITSHA